MVRRIQYAHLYGSKVHVTVNTLLFDNELEDARKLIWQLHLMFLLTKTLSIRSCIQV